MMAPTWKEFFDAFMRDLLKHAIRTIVGTEETNMGEPAELTPKERIEAMQLADAMYAAVDADESMVDVICAAAYPDHWHTVQSPTMTEEEEAVLLRLAQQCRDLRAALDQALNVIDPKMMNSPTVDQWRAVVRPKP